MKDIVVYLSIFILLLGCIVIIVASYIKIFQSIIVYDYERGLKYYKGKFQGILEPGKYRVFTPNTLIKKIDIRPSFITISNQEVLTLEGISIKISAALNYKVSDCFKAYNNADDYNSALYLLVQVALREVISSNSLDEILEKRKEINEKIKEKVFDRAKDIGIDINDINIKDITLNSELKKAYMKAAAAKKEGMANLEKARAEAATMRSLANTAKMLENNPQLFKLRLLQSLDSSTGNKVVINVSEDELKS